MAHETADLSIISLILCLRKSLSKILFFAVPYLLTKISILNYCKSGYLKYADCAGLSA